MEAPGPQRYAALSAEPCGESPPLASLAQEHVPGTE